MSNEIRSKVMGVKIRRRMIGVKVSLRYLSGLLTGRLVLGSLTEVFYSFVFGQEVLLLRHFLPLDALVQQLPVNGPNRRQVGHSWSPEDEPY